MRQLERRRVLDAALQSTMVELTATVPTYEVTTASTGEEALTFDWSASGGSESAAAVGAFLAAAGTGSELQSGSDVANGEIVNDLPPVVTTTNHTALEGNVLDLSGMDGAPTLALIVDPADPNPHTATVNWGDGTGIQSVTVLDGPFDASFAVGMHTFADDGTYTVTVTAKDSAGNTGSDTFLVTVGNVAPTLNVTPADTTINEDSSLSFDAVLTDPGFDNSLNPNSPVAPNILDPKNESFRYFVDWGDGSTIPSTAVADTNGAPGVDSTGTFNGSHSYTDGGVYTVTVRVADDNMSGNFASGSDGVDFVEFSFDVNVNSKPVVTAAADQVVLEGESLDLSGMDGSPSLALIVDPADPDPHTATVNWGDGTGDEPVSVLDGPFDASFALGTHTYADDGTYVVTVTAKDSAGNTGSDTFTVTVGNVLPALAVTPSDTSINEGESVSFDALFNDPGFDNSLNPNPPAPPNIVDPKNESFRYYVDWGDGNTIPSTTVADTNGSPGVDSTGMFGHNHTYLVGGTYTVYVRIADDNMSGNFTSGADYVEYSFEVSVNSKPVVTAADDQAVSEGELLDLSGMDGAPSLAIIVDPNDPDPHTATVNWGDGTGDQVVMVSDGPFDVSFVSGTHIYADDGTYTVTVTAMDSAGNTDSDTFTVVVSNVVPELTVNTVTTTINEGQALGIRGLFSDPGFDNPFNPTMPATGDQFNESFTYYIEWGDGRDTITSTPIADTNGGPGVDSAGVIGRSHTYADDGVYTVKVRIADDNMSGDFTSGMNGIDFVEYSFDVTVNNVVPELTVNTLTTTINEGEALGIRAFFNDPGFDNSLNPTTPSTGDPFNESFTYYIEWGDGRDTVMSTAVADMNGAPGVDSSGMFGRSHTYADDGVYTVRVRVADDNMTGDFTGGANGVDFVEYSFDVTVDNVLPELAVTPSATNILEGQSVTFSATFNDPGFDNPLNPTTPSIGDPFNESFTYYIEWGDGRDTVTSTAVADMNGGPGFDSTGMFNGSHTYADDGVYTVRVRIADDNMSGDFTSGVANVDFVEYSFDVTVNNVVPELTVNTVTTTLDEGDALGIRAFFNDPGFDNPFNPTTPSTGDPLNESFTYYIEWGDGRDTVMSTAVADMNGGPGIDSTGMFNGSHTYADDGVYTVRVRIADDNMTGDFTGGSNGVDFVEYSFDVTVNNVVPELTVNTVTTTINEGEALGIRGLFNDPGFDNPFNPTTPSTGDPFNESFTYYIEWGDGRDTIISSPIADTNGGPGVDSTGVIGRSHTYADDGVYTVTVRIADDNMTGNFTGGVDGIDYVEYSFDVTVNNVVPDLTVNTPTTTINEGEALGIRGLFNDPGFDNPLNPTTPSTGDPFNESFRYYVEWGDGRDTIMSTPIADTNGGPGVDSTGVIGRSHTYADDGVYTVKVRIADDNMTGNFTGGANGVDYVEYSFTVTVNNVVPELGVTPSATMINEGQSVNFAALFSDPGFDNPLNPTTPATGDPFNESFRYFVSWGDGRDTVPSTAVADMNGAPGADSSGAFNGSHTYADDGSYTVRVRVADDNMSGNFTTGINGVDFVEQTFTVVVNNVRPSLTVNHPASPITINEGQSVNFAALFSDPGFDNPLNPTTPATGDPFSESFRYHVNWGDGRELVASQSVADMNGGPGVNSTGAFNGVHTYADDGTYTVRVRIADDNMTGNFASGTNNVDFVEHTFTVIVNNVRPTLGVTNSTATINEGQSVNFAALFSDPGFDNALNTNPTAAPAIGDPLSESFRYHVNWGDGRDIIATQSVADTNGAPGVNSTGTFNGVHTYADDGTYTVTVRIADDNMTGNFASGLANVDFVQHTFTVIVNNVRPTLGVTNSTATINENQSVNFDALFSDPGFDNLLNTSPTAGPAIGDPLSESFRYHVNWGDGRDTVATLAVADMNGAPGVNSTGTFNGLHTYADDGTYTVRIRIADDNMTGNFAGGAANVDFVEHTFTVIVNNVDPTLTNIQALEVNEGQAFVLSADANATTKNLGVILQDPGFDNLLNPNAATAQIPDPTHEVFTGMSIDWGDGTATSALTINNAARTIGSPGVMTTVPLEHLSHTYADDGVYTVRLTVRDDNGPFVTRELQITVRNVVPTLGVAANQTVFESDDLVLPSIGNFTDPGFDNPLNPNPPVLPSIATPTQESFAYFIDWGDGRDQIGTMSAADINGAAGILSNGSFGSAHNYADDGVYTVTVRLADDNMGAFTTASMFTSGTGGVDFVQQTFTVTVLNVAPSFVPVSGQPILGDEINTQGITTIHVLFSDPGYDNPLNNNTVAVGDPRAETFTYLVNWGDGTTDTIAVTFVSGTPVVVSSLTSVVASDRVSGSADVLTAGGFDVQHRYLGPPDPLNPTADITITLTLIDDNGGSVTASVSVGNPGIDTTNVAIDTTPEVPRLEFVQMAAPQGVLDQPSAAIGFFQSGDFRAATGFLSVTSERYLMLVVIAPDGSEVESHRISDEALSDLRGLFSTLPDGRYKVFLVRTDNNAKRLVIEVYVRRGRVIDPSDESEGTRDRPPTGEAEVQAVPLDQNPLLERIPNQDQLQEDRGAKNGPPDSVQGEVADAADAVPADEDEYAPTAANLRWAAPVAGLALVAGRNSWSQQLDAAFQQADERAWQRLRRSGRVARWLPSSAKRAGSRLEVK